MFPSFCGLSRRLDFAAFPARRTVLLSKKKTKRFKGFSNESAPALSGALAASSYTFLENFSPSASASLKHRGE
jgi:hypothetical protein